MSTVSTFGYLKINVIVILLPTAGTMQLPITDGRQEEAPSAQNQEWLGQEQTKEKSPAPPLRLGNVFTIKKKHI